MTLSLDEVRTTRFHLARRNGYEPQDVDTFVDKVEATMTQLTEENETLRKQVEALRDAAQAEPAAAGDGADASSRIAELEAENAELRGRLETPAEQPVESDDRDARISELELENTELHLQVEGLMETAAAASSQADAGSEPAAPQSLIVTTSAEASPAVIRLVQLATEQAEQVVGDARAEAERLVAEARARGEESEAQARAGAEQLKADTQSRRDEVEAELEARRAEILGSLESDREALAAHVDSLRSFEGDYRQRLRDHLNEHIANLEAARFEPETAPSAPPENSGTPRLDALLNNE